MDIYKNHRHSIKVGTVEVIQSRASSNVDVNEPHDDILRKSRVGYPRVYINSSS